MREIRQYGSEGGGAGRLFLPLYRCSREVLHDHREGEDKRQPESSWQVIQVFDFLARIGATTVNAVVGYS